MYYSKSWLKQYLPDTNLDDPNIRDLITYSLAEVEGVKEIGAMLDKIVVGEVVDVKNHPKSDHLKIVKADVIKGTNDPNDNLEIVCGAPNVSMGQKVAVCLVGGSVINAKTGEKMLIEKREVAGVFSNGMICSEKELGIGENHEGILVLPEESIVGSDLLGILQDKVFEIENKSFSHRPDCFGHKGVAREISAITNTKFIDRQIPTFTMKNEVNLGVEIKSKKCLRYSSLVIKGVSIKESPLWLQIKLNSIGIRPVNNVVDVTNYIMYDLGQPLHSFDLTHVENSTIIVREAKSNEELLTLDEKKRELKEGMLVIADSKKILALAGIMGGKYSEISNDTTNILLESACFDKNSMRSTSRELGLRTEASTRYEKGLDPETTLDALKLSAQLIIELAGGEICSEIVDVYEVKENPRFIELDLHKIKRFLGINIKKEEVVKILNRLNIDTEHSKFVSSENPNPVLNSSYLNLIIPSYRKDLNIEVDILEEIARIYGYDKFKPTLPSKSINPGKLNNHSRVSRIIKNYLTQYSFNEIYSYSFVGKSLWEKCMLNTDILLNITNAISPDLELVRNTLIPSLLDKAQLNFPLQKNLRLYELNRVVFNELTDEKIPHQPWKLGIVVVNNKIESVNTINNVVFNMLIKLNINYEIVNLTKYNEAEKLLNIELYNPSQSAVLLDKSGKVLGLIGKLNPYIKDNFKLATSDIQIAELDIDKIVSMYTPDVINYKAISAYQYNLRDISFTLKDNIELDKIIITIKSHNLTNLEDIYLQDHFEKEGQYSLTLRALIVSKENTMSENEIEKVVKEIQEILIQDFKVEIR